MQQISYLGPHIFIFSVLQYKKNTYFWAGRNSGLVGPPSHYSLPPLLHKRNHTVWILFSLASFTNIMFVGVIRHVKHRSCFIIFFVWTDHNLSTLLLMNIWIVSSPWLLQITCSFGRSWLCLLVNICMHFFWVYIWEWYCWVIGYSNI